MRRYIAIAVASAVVAGYVGVRCESSEKPAADHTPDVYVEKINSTPDMTQTDPDAKLPEGGRVHCGPVAVSNSLVWLAKNGFESLASPFAGGAKAQYEMARLLGEKKYMNTNLKTGTGVGGVLEGVARYLADREYEYSCLKFQGWRKHPSRFGSGVAVPELHWIKNGLLGNSAVWLNVGWYKYNRSSDEYLRIGGHWVTLVGYGVDRQGKSDSHILIIHDPAPRSGRGLVHNFVRVKSIKHGMLTGKHTGLPRQAKGYYIMGDGMCVKKSADFGILDGAVVMKMREKTPHGQP